jgi:hypothetical protein
MSAVWCNADKMTKSFLRLAGKGRLVNSVEDGLVPVKTEEWAHVNGHPKEDSEGNGPVEGFTRSAVQDQADVLETK